MSAIAVVAPEPVFWLQPVIEAASQMARVCVLAPWIAPRAVLARADSLPGSLAQFIRRRGRPKGASCVSVPGWNLGEGTLRAWVRGRTDRDMRARFLVRRAVDVWAGRWLARASERPLAILAPSLAAHRTLAAAKRLGVAGLLIEDMPSIRALHRDLDGAYVRHPECRFLARYRAPGSLLVRQEVERALADAVLVRGLHARGERERAGLPASRVVDLPMNMAGDNRSLSSNRPSIAKDGTETVRVLLAGLAAARHGTVEALHVIRSRPAIELLVRAGEGLEPAGLLDHPRVRAARPDELSDLRGVHLVIAPAWCETYPRELAAAAVRGVPTVATRRAAGFFSPSRTVPPGEAEALGRALDELIDQLRAGRSPGPTAALSPRALGPCLQQLQENPRAPWT